MLRVAVIYCLALTTAAGPWLCCCTSARVAALCNLAASSLGVKGEERRACCGCVGDSGHKHSPERERGPDAPGQCPCKAFAPVLSTSAAKPVETTSPAGEDFADAGPTAACESGRGAGLSASRSALRERATSLHSGHPRDLLAVLQTLRC